MTLSYQVNASDTKQTIKDILKKQFHLSNRLLTKLKLHQQILIDNQVARVNEIPMVGSEITICLDFAEDDDTVPQEYTLDVLYEDEAFLAINKPANLVVHPSAFHPDKTLSNYVKAYLHNGKKIRPINRLDNGTSGIVLFAKNEYIQEAFKNSDPAPIKKYFAIVHGVLEQKAGTLDFPIARKKGSIIEREVNFEEGQKAITHYKVLDEFSYKGIIMSKLEIILETRSNTSNTCSFSTYWTSISGG